MVMVRVRVKIKAIVRISLRNHSRIMHVKPNLKPES